MTRHALIVEDDVNTAAALSRVLKSLDFSTSIAPTLQSAKEQIEQQIPDVVLLDLTLPDGNGLEFMAGLRNSHDIRFVVITGDLTQQAAVKSLRANADDFLVKPVSLAELRNTIAKSLSDSSGRHGDSPLGDTKTASLDDKAIVEALVGKTFWGLEKDLLFATLERHDGDKAEAAKTLGISLKTLYNRLHAYS